MRAGFSGVEAIFTRNALLRVGHVELVAEPDFVRIMVIFEPDQARPSTTTAKTKAAMVTRASARMGTILARLAEIKCIEEPVATARQLQRWHSMQPTSRSP
jgi:hypothetical protein